MTTAPRPRSVRRLLVLSTAGVALVVAAMAWSHARRVGGDRVDWQHDWATASADAATRGKPMLVDFETDWCPYCNKMKNTTWADRPTAAAVADRTVAVQVDCDQHKDLEQKYAIQSLPTLMLVAADGHEIRRVEGYQTTDDVRRLLAGGT